MRDTISSISVLTQQECQEVCSVVHKLNEFWLKRNPTLPFYTLGAASYLDAAQDQQNYYTKAQVYNPILRAHLGWLYERLANVLAHSLQAPISYQHNLAMPGFHVYLACKFFEQQIASIHCDSQYKLVNWEFPDETDFNNPISFTLTISLPKFGGGLNIWDLHYQEVLKISHAEFVQLVRSRAKSYYPYQVGQMVLHSGHTVHQVAPARNIQLDDERITLQGHTLFTQGHWQLYW